MILVNEKKLNLALEKAFFLLPTTKQYSPEVCFDTVTPVHSKIAASHKIASRTTTIELMKDTGSIKFLKFSFKFFDKNFMLK